MMNRLILRLFVGLSVLLLHIQSNADVTSVLRPSGEAIRRSEAARSPSADLDQRSMEEADEIAHSVVGAKPSSATALTTNTKHPMKGASESSGRSLSVVPPSTAARASNVLQGLSGALPPPASLPSATPPSSNLRVFVFISESLSDEMLGEAFEAALTVDAVVVIRGIKPGDELNSFARRRMYPILKRMGRAPKVEIDPRPFSDYAVTSVPSIAVVSHDKFVTVSGTFSSDYAKHRLEQGASGNLGQFGQIWPIEEPDLLNEIKRRVAAINWDEKRDAAFDRFWKKAPFIDLPHAKESKSYLFDPTVVVSEDVKLPDGRFIAHAGDKLNPLAYLPFTSIVVVIDATDPLQIKYARKVAESPFALNRKVEIMTTRVDRNRGWQALEEYQTNLGNHQLGLLNQSIADRFQISSVPTVITSSGRQLLIKEVALDADGNETIVELKK